MSVTPDLPSATDLAARLARLQPLVLGEPQKARVELLKVLQQAHDLEATPQETLALLELAWCDFLQGQYAGMEKLAQQAL